MRLEMGSFVFVVALWELQLGCFGHRLDLLPDGAFWTNEGDFKRNRHGSWGEIGERLMFWKPR